jgi:hypothetical protein
MTDDLGHDRRKRERERREADVKRWDNECCLGCRFSDFSDALYGPPYDAVTTYMYDEAWDYEGMVPASVPVGECRRHAPRVVVKKGEAQSFWPPVFASDTCGEQAKVTP